MGVTETVHRADAGFVDRPLVVGVEELDPTAAAEGRELRAIDADRVDHALERVARARDDRDVGDVVLAVGPALHARQRDRPRVVHRAGVGHGDRDETTPASDLHEDGNAGHRVAPRVTTVHLNGERFGRDGAAAIGRRVSEDEDAVRSGGRNREGRGTPYFCYVDEVAVLATLPLPLEGLLERARGHGVGLTLAPQALSQLSQSLRASLLANVGSLVCFAQNSDEEAAALAKALGGVSASQLQNLGRFEVAMRLSLATGLKTRPMTGKTLSPTGACSDPAKKCGAPRPVPLGRAAHEVDQALARRHDLKATTEEDEDQAGSGDLGVIRRRP